MQSTTWKVLNLGWVVTKKQKKNPPKKPKQNQNKEQQKTPLDKLPMKFIEFPSVQTFSVQSSYYY